MSKQSDVKSRRKYNPLHDTRRFSDGIRIHPYVHGMLWFGGHKLNIHYPNHTISAAQFSRATLPILNCLKFIGLVEPLRCIPEQLNDRDRKLARRGGMLPIWMPTLEGYQTGDDLWDDLDPDIMNGKLVWRKNGKMLGPMPKTVH